jgi:hypothetical protein
MLFKGKKPHLDSIKPSLPSALADGETNVSEWLKPKSFSEYPFG